MKLFWHQLNAYLNRNEVLIVLLLVVVILRLPTLFEPFWYGDENIYLAIGQGMRHGLTLYRDITDYPNKPPLIYLIAAAVQTVFGMRLLLLGWNLIHVIVFHQLTRFFSSSHLFRLFATLLFIYLTQTPVIEGTIANAEIFFIMPTSIAVWLLLRQQQAASTHQNLHIFLAGLCLGFAFLFKIHVLFDIVALGLFFFVFSKLKDLHLSSLLKIIKNKNTWIFTFATLTPITLVLIVWSLFGVSPVSLLKNALGSSGYVSVWTKQDLLVQTIGFGSLKARLVLLGLLTFILFCFRHRFSPKALFISLWLIFALFATLLSARPYPHYLIQLIPPVVFGLLLITSLKDQLSRYTITLIMVLIVAAYYRFDFHPWSVISYYQNYYAYLTHQIDRTEFYARHDWRMPRNYALANYIRQITLPSDRIYVWGTEPEIYVLANRSPMDKLVVSFHVEDLNYYSHTIETMMQTPPKLVIVMESEPRRFPELTNFLATDYLLVNTIGDPRYQTNSNHGSNALVYMNIKKPINRDNH